MIYTQQHQITDYIENPNWQLSKLQEMIDSCKAGKQARAIENEETFDEQKFNAWLADVLWQQMNKDVQNYIYSKYDQGTQASLQALHSDSSSPPELKQAIESMWAWIRSVMQYYYQRKAEILSGQVVKWDFTQFDSTDPGISLGALMG
jgi:hypothetical protein